jgi:hypothetical protein
MKTNQQCYPVNFPALREIDIDNDIDNVRHVDYFWRESVLVFCTIAVIGQTKGMECGKRG